MVGSVDALGAWDAGRGAPMTWHDGDVWEVGAGRAGLLWAHARARAGRGSGGGRCSASAHTRMAVPPPPSLSHRHMSSCPRGRRSSSILCSRSPKGEPLCMGAPGAWAWPWAHPTPPPPHALSRPPARPATAPPTPPPAAPPCGRAASTAPWRCRAAATWRRCGTRRWPLSTMTTTGGCWAPGAPWGRDIARDMQPMLAAGRQG